MRYEVASTDILIIGGGGAGLRAAIEARKHNVQVTLVSKRKAGHFNSTALAAGLVTCSCRDPDKELFDLVVSEEDFLNDQRLVARAL